MRPVTLAPISLVLALSACGPSEQERAVRAADSIVAIADSAGLVARTTIEGQALALMVHDCKVYDLAEAPGRKGSRTVILKPDSYPWPTFCMRQSIEVKDNWVVIELGRTGFGAGGCCATGGLWRTRDARTWERDGKKGWEPVRPDSTA